jgi:hypothetical protein
MWPIISLQSPYNHTFAVWAMNWAIAHQMPNPLIAGNCWGLISLPRLEGPANRSFRRFPLDFVSLKANREREKGTRGSRSYESVLRSREQAWEATRNAVKQSSRRNLTHGCLSRVTRPKLPEALIGHKWEERSWGRNICVRGCHEATSEWRRSELGVILNF